MNHPATLDNLASVGIIRDEEIPRLKRLIGDADSALQSEWFQALYQLAYFDVTGQFEDTVFKIAIYLEKVNDPKQEMDARNELLVLIDKLDQIGLITKSESQTFHSRILNEDLFTRLHLYEVMKTYYQNVELLRSEQYTFFLEELSKLGLLEAEQFDRLKSQIQTGECVDPTDVVLFLNKALYFDQKAMPESFDAEGLKGIYSQIEALGFAPNLSNLSISTKRSNRTLAGSERFNHQVKYSIDREKYSEKIHSTQLSPFGAPRQYMTFINDSCFYGLNQYYESINSVNRLYRIRLKSFGSQDPFYRISFVLLNFDQANSLNSWDGFVQVEEVKHEKR